MDIYIIFLHIEASTITAVCLCKCVSLCKQFGPFFPTALLQFIQVCRHSLMPQCHSISVRLWLGHCTFFCAWDYRPVTWLSHDSRTLWYTDAFTVNSVTAGFLQPDAAKQAFQIISPPPSSLTVGIRCAGMFWLSCSRKLEVYSDATLQT